MTGPAMNMETADGSGGSAARRCRDRWSGSEWRWRKTDLSGWRNQPQHKYLIFSPERKRL